MRFSKHCKGQHKLKYVCVLKWVKSWNGIKTSCWFYSAGRESGPSSLNTAVSRASEVGVSGVSWERSSEHLLTVGEITSGLVSQDSVLCSELAVVVVVATLWGTGSNSSSSSSRTGVWWISAEETQTLQSSCLLSGLRPARNRGQSHQLTAESLWILLGNLPFERPVEADQGDHDTWSVCVCMCVCVYVFAFYTKSSWLTLSFGKRCQDPFSSPRACECAAGSAHSFVAVAR